MPTLLFGEIIVKLFKISSNENKNIGNNNNNIFHCLSESDSMNNINTKIDSKITVKVFDSYYHNSPYFTIGLFNYEKAAEIFSITPNSIHIDNEYLNTCYNRDTNFKLINKLNEKNGHMNQKEYEENNHYDILVFGNNFRNSISLVCVIDDVDTGNNSYTNRNNDEKNNGYDISNDNTSAAITTNTNNKNNENDNKKYLTIIPAKFLSSTMIQCKISLSNLILTNAMLVNGINIYVSNNAYDKSSNFVVLKIENKLNIVSSVFPIDTFLPGGTEIFVNFNRNNIGSIYCKFIYENFNDNSNSNSTSNNDRSESDSNSNSNNNDKKLIYNIKGYQIDPLKYFCISPLILMPQNYILLITDDSQIVLYNTTYKYIDLPVVTSYTPRVIKYSTVSPLSPTFPLTSTSTLITPIQYDNNMISKLIAIGDSNNENENNMVVINVLAFYSNVIYGRWVILLHIYSISNISLLYLSLFSICFHIFFLLLFISFFILHLYFFTPFSLFFSFLYSLFFLDFT